MENAELLKTFDDLAVSQRKMADDIIRLAGPTLPAGLAETVQYLRDQAEVCEQTAQAIRDGALD